MGQSDFPLCIYCDEGPELILIREDNEVTYHCTGCGNSVDVETCNG